MNARVKIGLIIGLHIMSLLIIELIWMNGIREQRVLKSKVLKIQIIKPSVENQLISEQDIKELISVFYKKDWRKMPVFALRATELEHFLEMQPTVHHAEVYIDAMENLHVDMYQRDPLLRIVEAQGAQYYIDVEGRKIPNSNRYSARVPVVTGIQNPMQGIDIAEKANFAYRAVFNIGTEINADPFIKSLIEQIDVLPNAEFVLVPKIGNEKILVGGNENISEKLNKLKFFYQEGLRYEGWNVYQTIDLKNKDQVVCRKNQTES